VVIGSRWSPSWAAVAEPLGADPDRARHRRPAPRDGGTAEATCCARLRWVFGTDVPYVCAYAGRVRESCACGRVRRLSLTRCAELRRDEASTVADPPALCEAVASRSWMSRYRRRRAFSAGDLDAVAEDAEAAEAIHGRAHR
jgi:hypothetical protein